MGRIQIKQVLNKVAILLLTLSFGLLQAQGPFGTPVGPGRQRKTPIDMYEGILVGVAVMLIIGYYFYSRNKRVANS